MTVAVSPLSSWQGRRLLDGAGSAWLVTRASVEIFLAEADGGTPFEHLATVAPGGLVFGIAPERCGAGLLADLADGAELVPLVGDEDAPTESHPGSPQAAEAAAMAWIAALDGALSRDQAPERGVDTVLSAGCPLALGPGQRVRGERAGVWCGAPGSARLLGGVEIGEGAATVCLPMSRTLWLEAASASVVTVSPSPFDGGLPSGLAAVAAFSALAVRLLAQRRRLRLDAEERRTARCRGEVRTATERALGRLAALLDMRPAGVAGGGDREHALYDACATVCRVLGVPFKAHPARRRTDPLTVSELALMAGFRRRRVKLRGSWWQSDIGPLIGYLDEERLPVALLFDPLRGGYRLVAGGDGGRPVDAALAARLHPTAEMCYAPLPARPAGLADVLALGLRQCRADCAFVVIASLVGAALGLAVPLAVGVIFNVIVPGHYAGKLLEIGCALVILALTAMVFQITGDVATLRIQGRLSGSVMAAVWDRLLRLPHRFCAGYAPGDLNLRAQSVETLSRAVATMTSSLLGAATVLLFNLAAMTWWVPATAAVALVLVIVLVGAAALAVYCQKKAIFEGEEVASDLSSLVTELVGGITKLRLAGAEGRAFVRWAQTFAEMRRRSVTAQRVGVIFGVFLSGFDVLGLAAMFAVVVHWLDGPMPVGNFLAFIAAFAAFQRAAMQIAGVCLAGAVLLPQMARVRPILEAVPEVEEGRTDPRRLSGAIEVNNVTFGYGPAEAPVLRGVSLRIAPGQFVAIVGPSGCGKSTLMRLMLGWENPWSGAIFYDRKDLRLLSPRAVRQQIGVVLQNGRLMPGTIYENIIGGDARSLDEAWEAARIAGLEADIRAMPMGMHTVLTEGSASLSGGQIQRLMIARAVLSKPAILMFDEATSSLDTISQAHISRHLEQMAVTRLVIAHRLSTIRQADMIYVLEGGRVVEAGTYDQLATAGGTFSRLAV